MCISVALSPRAAITGERKMRYPSAESCITSATQYIGWLKIKCPTFTFAMSLASVDRFQQFFTLTARIDVKRTIQNPSLHLNSVVTFPIRNCAVNVNISYIVSKVSKVSK